MYLSFMSLQFKVCGQQSLDYRRFATAIIVKKFNYNNSLSLSSTIIAFIVKWNIYKRINNVLLRFLTKHILGQYRMNSNVLVWRDVRPYMPSTDKHLQELW